MSEPNVLARRLAACSRSGGEPHLAAVDPKLWTLALEQLVAWDALDAAAFAAPRLHDAFPTSDYFRSMAMVLARLPPPSGPPFAVDPEKEVQVVRAVGAQVVVFAFTGRFGSLGLPLQILHRWFGRLGAHIVYLRDKLDNAFVRGMPELGADHTGACEALGRMAQDLGASRIACYGNSSGGYAALRCGLDLGASTVLAFGALTTLTDEAFSPRMKGRRPFVPGPDLGDLYASAGRRPQVRLVFGAQNDHDRAHAERLADVPGVALEAVAGWSGHNAFIDLIARGRFEAVLAELVAPPALSAVEV